jgi:hypothetical protein
MMTTRRRLLALAILGPALLAGCLSSGSSLRLNARPDEIFIRNSWPIEIDREYVYRYTCGYGQVLECQCASRLAKTCDCRCP